MEWEAYKDPDNVHPHRDERLSEFALRLILSNQYGIESRDVTKEQIRNAVSDFCRHYGPILMVPNGGGRLPMKAPEPTATTSFWSEREKEFRQRRRGECRSVEAVSSSPDEWTLLDASHGDDGLATPRCARVFKSLAREAFKGFAGPQSDESWIDWLNEMRRAEYCERSEFGLGRHTAKGVEKDRLAGQPPPAGAMIRFVPIPKYPNGPSDEPSSPEATGIDRIEIEHAWDSALFWIEDIFDASADFCLELRSAATTQDASQSPAKNTNASTVVDDQRWGAPRTEEAVSRNRVIGGELIGTATDAAPAAPSGAASRRKPGPQRDYETALKVAAVIASLAADGNWRAQLENLCEALDEAGIRRPQPWKAKGYMTWYDCLVAERSLVIKAIEHHQERAKERKETFS
jgi:hypothetical protein